MVEGMSSEYVHIPMYCLVGRYHAISDRERL